VALVQQVSDLTSALTKVLSTEDAKLASFNVSIQSNMDALNGGMSTYMGPADIDMSLTYILNQMADTEKTLTDLEASVSVILKKTKGVFIGRNVNYDYSGKKVVNYRLKLSDYNLFTQLTNELYLKQMDREFTEALEAKLSED